MDQLPDQTKNAIFDAIKSNQKLEAIKLFKDATGCNLREAKEHIESMMSTDHETGTGRLTEDTSSIEEAKTELILDEIFAGRKLDAVKLYRDQTGSSLLEAKNFVEELTEQLKKDSPEQFRTASTAGCSTLFFIALLFAFGYGSLFAFCIV